MAVSLMSTLLLVSSEFERDVELLRPQKGYVYLKQDFLRPNLVDLSSEVKNSFMLSNNNMNTIKVNSVSMHKNLKNAVIYAFSKDKYDSKTLLPRTLRYISEDAEKNKELSLQVSESFTETGHFIEELLSTLRNSQSFGESQKADCTALLDKFEKERNETETLLKSAKEQEEKFDKEVERTKAEFFNATAEAAKVQCVLRVEKVQGSCIFHTM